MQLEVYKSTGQLLRAFRLAHLLPAVLKDALPLPPRPPTASNALLPAPRHLTDRWDHGSTGRRPVATLRLKNEPEAAAVSILGQRVGDHLAAAARPEAALRPLRPCAE